MARRHRRPVRFPDLLGSGVEDEDPLRQGGRRESAPGVPAPAVVTRATCR